MEIKVSIAEIMDKLTILSIKKRRLKDPIKLRNVDFEHDYLIYIVGKNGIDIKSNEYKDLYKVNLSLWNIEDKIRNKDRNRDFDKEFIKLARCIYFLNDRRAEIKKNINMKYNSEIVEEKSYEKY